MTITRRSASTLFDFLSLCNEAKGGSLFGVRLGDEFAVVVEKLGPPDSVATDSPHVRYGPVEIAADPNGRVCLLYAEVPEDLCIELSAVAGEAVPAGDATSVERARFVYDEEGFLSSVAVWPPPHTVPDDATFDWDSSVPTRLRTRDAWLTLCSETMRGSVCNVRPGDSVDSVERLYPFTGLHG